MPHGKQDLTETADIDIFMLCMYIQILIGQFGQQMLDIFDNGTQTLDKRCRGICEHTGFVFAFYLRHRGFQIAFHKQFHPFGTGFHRFTDTAGQNQGYYNGNNYGDDDYRDINDHSVARSGQIIQLRCGNGKAPSVRIIDGSISGEHFVFSVFIAAESDCALAHVGMNGGQFAQRRIALRFSLNILNGNRIEGNIGNRIAGFIDHIGPAVFANLDSGYDIV